MASRNEKLKKFTDAQLAECRSAGLSAPEIAEKFSTSKTAVYMRIRKVDGTQKPPNKPEYHSWNGVVTRLRQRTGESDDAFTKRVEERRERQRVANLRYAAKPEAKMAMAESQVRRQQDPIWWANFLGYQRTYRKGKYKEDPAYRIGVTLRGRLSKVFNGYLLNQRWNTRALTGCTIEELIAHLTKQFAAGMSLANYGEWEIDHVIPVWYFDLNCPLQQVLAFHFTNLQPLWKPDNRRKKHPDPALGIPMKKRVRRKAPMPAEPAAATA